MWQRLNPLRHVDKIRTICWSSNRASKRGRKVTFNLTISETADLLGFFLHNHFYGLQNGLKKKYPVGDSSLGILVDARGQRRMERLLRADKIITQITTYYNQDMHKSIECTACWILKQMGYISRTHCMPLLPAKPGNWGYNLYWLTKIQQQKIEKMLPGCKDPGRMDSGFYQQFRLAVVV